MSGAMQLMFLPRERYNRLTLHAVVMMVHIPRTHSYTRGRVHDITGSIIMYAHH